MAAAAQLDWPALILLLVPQISAEILAIILAIKTPAPRAPGALTRATDLPPSTP